MQALQACSQALNVWASINVEKYSNNLYTLFS
jgi:hypothetical protein